MLRLYNFLAFLLPVFASLSSPSQVNSTGLPLVDLGYVRQRATEYNETGGYYIYRNIRFARSPVGDLRFRKPAPPLFEPEIQDGNIEMTNCHQAFLEDFVVPGVPSYDLGVEDCLFLDVYVPKGVKPGDNVPVLAWWHGGGYLIGSKTFLAGKTFLASPVGLMQSSDKPIIYVAANYRLGSFGWLANPNDDSIEMNVGLHDVRAAMEWIAKYISKFGGDKNRVTVMGESAGGGVLYHTITANGGKGSPPPFQQAILQSPGIWPDKNKYEARLRVYNAFQSYANCTSVQCLRDAPTETLRAANARLLYQIEANFVGNTSSELGFLPFTPAVDGDYVPDLAVKLFREGRYHRTLKGLIVSNTQYEGRAFYTADSAPPGTFAEFVLPIFPERIHSTLISLYPVTDPTSDYDRVASFMGDFILDCYVNQVAESFKDRTYRFIFNIPPAIHGGDISYTFYNELGGFGNTVDGATARRHQKYITDFVVNGAPAEDRVWQRFGVEQRGLFFEPGGDHMGIDPWKDGVCDFWQDRANYLPLN